MKQKKIMKTNKIKILIIIILSNSIFYMGCSIKGTKSSISYNLQDSVTYFDSNMQWPKIMYKGDIFNVVNAKRMYDNKLICTYDTIVSLIVEDYLREARCFQEDAIFNFFVILRINEKGIVTSVLINDPILNRTINYNDHKFLFVSTITSCFKQLLFTPAKINNKDVECSLIIRLHIDVNGLSSFRYKF